jgi:hypothetical protein
MTVANHARPVPSNDEFRLRMGEMTLMELEVARIGYVDGSKQIGELNIPSAKRVRARLVSCSPNQVLCYQAAFRLGHYQATH